MPLPAPPQSTMPMLPAPTPFVPATQGYPYGSPPAAPPTGTMPMQGPYGHGFPTYSYPPQRRRVAGLATVAAVFGVVVVLAAIATAVVVATGSSSNTKAAPTSATMVTVPVTTSSAPSQTSTAGKPNGGGGYPPEPSNTTEPSYYPSLPNDPQNSQHYDYQLLDAMSVGDCFTIGSAYAITRSSCSQPHTNQIYAVLISNATSAATVKTDAATQCDLASNRRRLDGTITAATATEYYFYPNAMAIANGNRSIQCTIQAPAGTTFTTSYVH